MFPLVPFLLIATLIGSVVGLGWYESLKPHEKEEANRLAVSYAKQLYGRAIEDLTENELKHVHDTVKRHFIRVV